MNPTEKITDPTPAGALDRSHERTHDRLMRFEALFGAAPLFEISAPGRINLIGEHIDYAGGLVMPMTIQLGTQALMRPNHRSEVRVFSERYSEQVIIRPQEVLREARGHWSDFVRGYLSIATHRQLGAGFDLYVTSNIEMGGLSSSASFLAIIALANRTVIQGEASTSSLDDTERLALALQCKQVENEWIGVPSGIMDPAAIFLGGIRQLDCLTLKSTLMPELSADVTLVLMDTKVPRTLASSAYQERVRELQAISEHGESIGLKRLRHLAALSDDLVSTLDHSLTDPTLKRRLRHVSSEHRRVQVAAEALHSGDWATLGHLMDQSHASLRDDYEVSCDALDWVTEASRNAPGSLGSRLTGAGFGGAAIALVEAGSLAAHEEAVRRNFAAKAGYEPNLVTLRVAEQAFTRRVPEI